MLSPELKTTALNLEIFGLKKWNSKVLDFVNCLSESHWPDNISVFKITGH